MQNLKRNSDDQNSSKITDLSANLHLVNARKIKLSYILPPVLSSPLTQKLEFEWKPEQEIYREISHATFGSDPIIHWLASARFEKLSQKLQDSSIKVLRPR